MPAHRISLQIAQPIPIGPTDIEVVVDSSGSRLGRAKISKGGVDWLPAKNSVTRYTLTWEQLDALMIAHGKVRRTAT